MTPWTVVHGILQARILEWVAFPFSRGSSQPRDQTQVYLIVGGFFTSWATREAQEYWGGWPIPSPADLPDPGIEPGSPALQADSLPTELWGKLFKTTQMPASWWVDKYELYPYNGILFSNEKELNYWYMLQHDGWSKRKWKTILFNFIYMKCSETANL